MLVYQRHIVFFTMIATLLVSLVITGLVWITQILKLLHLINSGARVYDFFNIIILILPYLLFIITPFTTAIASLYIYNRLTEERQLLVLKSVGLSNIKLAQPALIVAMVMTIFSYYISIELLPNSYMKLKANLTNIRHNYATNVVQEKTFNQIAKSLTVYVDKKEKSGILKGIILFDNRDEKNLAILIAKRGKFILKGDDPFLELEDGTRQAYDNNGNMTKLHFESSIIELITKKKDLKWVKSDLNEYYIGELFSPEEYVSIEKQVRLIAEGHQRLVWPLYTFVLTFLSLAVFLRQPYNKKAGSKPIIIAAIFITIVVCAHFTLQNFISKNTFFLPVYYANLVIANLVGIWFYNQKRI